MPYQSTDSKYANGEFKNMNFKPYTKFPEGSVVFDDSSAKRHSGIWEKLCTDDELKKFRTSLSQKLRDEPEEGIMDGTSNLIPELESFSERIRIGLCEAGYSMNEEEQREFRHFLLNASFKQIGEQE